MILFENFDFEQFINSCIVDVIGYMLFWTCVYTFQFVLYLRQEFGLSLSSDSEYAFQLVSGFLLSSRGMWSLATFLVANWPAINAYFRNEQQRLQFGENAPPKEEEEQVQLNIALQREIVNFTALGIQRSVRDMDFFQKRDTHSISSRYSSLNIFVRYLYFSFENHLYAFSSSFLFYNRILKCPESAFLLLSMIQVFQILMGQFILHAQATSPATM